jgi:2,4-dienoyl-CoA reductase-like NADH-dependent reductase (Old Yellow Enzyme family)
MLDTGGIDAIICSGGTSSMNPMLLFRGASIQDEMIKVESNPLMKLGIKYFGGAMFRDYPYEETYFLEHSQRIRDHVQCGVCYVGGVCNNDSIERVMSAGFDFIQLGRSLLFDPDFPKHAAAESSYKNGCNHCNRCATLIEVEGGIYCPLQPDNGLRSHAVQ